MRKYCLIYIVSLIQLYWISVCESKTSKAQDQSCINKEISVSRTLDLGRNRTAWVIDNSLPQCTFRKWWSHIENIEGYRFQHFNFSRSKHNSLEYYDTSPWLNTVSTDHLIKTPSWNKLTQTVEKLLNQKVKVHSAQIEVLRTMDPMSPLVPSDCSANNYILTIFTNDMWNLNNYAQVSFYTAPETYVRGEKKVWEICETVHPHSLRAILWPSCHPVMIRAPCINHFSHFYYLRVMLTTNLKDQKKQTKTESNKMEKFLNFQLDPSEAKLDFSHHLTRVFNDGEPDRRVHIFDGLFSRDETRRWLQAIVNFELSVSDFQTDLLEDNDNVQWIGIHEVKDFVQTAMWPRFRALCEYVSNHTGWYPYDVATNHVRFADHTRIHPDSEVHQDELTLLLYLNDDLTATDYGETTFYVSRPGDGVHKFMGRGGEMYEAIGSVAPKLGRIAVFTNNIEHSAHPPSIKYPGCRYTFAVKVAKSRRLALIKMVYEGMEKIKMNEKMRDLKSQLETGVLDDEDTISTPTLEKILEVIEEKKLG